MNPLAVFVIAAQSWSETIRRQCYLTGFGQTQKAWKRHSHDLSIRCRKRLQAQTSVVALADAQSVLLLDAMLRLDLLRARVERVVRSPFRVFLYLPDHNVSECNE
jgi:hypothetical protein